MLSPLYTLLLLLGTWHPYHN